MQDAATILMANFVETLKQLNTYLSLGFTAALSALLLELQSARQYNTLAKWLAKPGEGPMPEMPDETKGIKLPFAILELGARTAKWLLIGATLVAGLLAHMATSAALATVAELRPQPDILRAMCTYPSLATTSKFIRVGASLSPAVLAGVVLWLQGRRLRILLGGQAADAPYVLAVPVLLVYGPLAAQLYRLPC